MLYYFSLAAEKTRQQWVDLLCEGPLNTQGLEIFVVVFFLFHLKAESEIQHNLGIELKS